MRRVGKNAQLQNICFTVVLVLLCPAGPWLAARADGLHATLNVRETHGVNRSNVAVSSGLPFPRGTLQHNSALSTRTLSGKPMASQFDVLTRWDDGSVKWGLISVFVSELKPYGEFRFHVAESGTSREGGGGADIHRLEQGVRVEYPAVSVTTNSLGLPQSVSLREGDNRIEVLAGDCRLLLLGQPVDPGRVLPDEVRIEEQGAVRTVVRSQGSLSVDEQTSFSFLSRVTVFASGQISTDYAVINHQVGGFHGFGVQLALADEFRSVRLHGAEIALHETNADQSSRAASVGVHQTGPETAVFDVTEFDGKSETLSFHGGMILSGDSKSLGLAVHDFWQRYPSQLVVNADRAQLWFLPINEKTATPLYRAGRAAQGAFTIRAQATASPRWSAAELGMTELHAFAGPVWYRDSGVLGNYALGDFDLPTGTYHGHVEDHMSFLRKRKYMVNEFGFWDFGDGRGSADSSVRRNNEFGISYAMLFHYLRTGDVRFFEEGVAFARHFRDVDTLHFGDMKGKSIRHTDNHVDGGSGYDTAHQWVEGMLLAYLLTGDRRSLEVAREMGVPLIAFAREVSPKLKARPETIPMTERDLGWTLLSLLFLEEVTGDPQYTDVIQDLIEGVVASQDEQRGHWPRELPHKDFPTGGASFMLGVLTEALMRYHEKSGDPAVAQAIVRSSYWLSNEMWNPEVRNIRYKQWDRFWDHYNDGRTIPMVLPGMVYARYLGRSDERYRKIIDDALKVYARSCADLDEHGEGRNFKSMGMMSRSMPRFFYYYNKTRNQRF